MSHKHLTVRLVAVLGFMAAIAGCAKSQATLSSVCLPGDRESAVCNVIEGSSANRIAAGAVGMTIGGGGEPALPNRVSGDYGTVGGGLNNVAGDRATVAGGSHNTAIGFRSTVSGGTNNTASGRDATVGGGSGNIASFTLATVAGGSRNTASSLQATVGGGDHNTASGAFATVGGGSGNSASGFDTTVSGGSGNVASGENANIGGGLANRATGKYSLVSGGFENRAGTADVDQVQYAAVGGGSHNTASGPYSTVPGGSLNTAAAAYSLAAGRRAVVKVSHDGTFLFADSNDSDFDSSAANEFAVRATGGVRFVTAVDDKGDPTAGVRLTGGSGSWESLSDRDAKTGFAPVDTRGILARLATVPISTWSYKTEDPSIRHIGPMAQDFRIFGVGADDKYISLIDVNGIALASIQGLYQFVQEQDARIREQERQLVGLQAENAALHPRIDKLDARVTALEQSQQTGAYAKPTVGGIPLGLLLFTGICFVGLDLAQRRRTRESPG